MKISPHEQGSVDWMIARAGIPTASEFDNLLTPELKIRTGQMPQSYLNKKLAEAWQGGPMASLNTFDMEQGRILEAEAIPFYELEFNETVQRVGLCTTDDGRVGCSPDGLIGDDGGIEIKCPAIQTHIGYLRNGELPKEYAPQVHGSLYVTGRKWWKFLAYRRHMPPLVLTIARDDAVMKTIHQALSEFLEDFDMEFQKLCRLNGGPPKHVTAKAEAAKSSPWQPNPNDLIP